MDWGSVKRELERVEWQTLVVLAIIVTFILTLMWWASRYEVDGTRRRR